jgi:hypothetical protein
MSTRGSGVLAGVDEVYGGWVRSEERRERGPDIYS